MTKFYVLRHGDILNPNQVLYLHMDYQIPLSPLGIKQVEAQAQKLKTHSIKTIYHSPLYRTKQSAEIVASILKTKNIEPDHALLEVKNPLQGIKLTEFDLNWSGNLYHPDLISKGGESIEQIRNRMMSAIVKYSQKWPNQAIILVSHGDPINILWLVAEKRELIKSNLGSDRHPVLGKPYAYKGSVTVFTYQKQQLTKKDYWPPMSLKQGIVKS
jgi:broad specificity phosphatase PhoE